MILDSSAIVALFLKGPGHEELIEKLSGAVQVGVGVATLTEATIVLSARLNRDARGTAARFLSEAPVATLPFGEAHYGVAVAAWLKYGRGRHPASLNFGDCMAYAIAKVVRQPLLCTGADFPKTDPSLA